jgi:hypothetical protein
MASFEKTPIEARPLLPVRIRELGLKLEGSPVERYVERLYRELEHKGLNHFRPACYLTDQWGCPSGEPVIGIPFYLADPLIGSIESALNDIEDEREIMMYLRHEAGHAFNYAYCFYKTPAWRELFGPFRRAYRENYRYVPFSKKFVRHIAGWYAQKHPDEDFAETFAVWLTPRSRWRDKYRGWPALRKLHYIDRVAHEVSDQPPLRKFGETDFTVEEMEETVEEFYKQTASDESQLIADLPLDTDLVDIFTTRDTLESSEFLRASDVVGSHRKAIIDKVSYWTGVRRTLVKDLVEAIVRRLEELDLVCETSRSRAQLVELTVYVTSLAMNYLTRGVFYQP